MPAPPELGDRRRAIRVIEVWRKAVAEQPRRADRHARIAGEVEIDLAVKGDRRGQQRVCIVLVDLRKYRVGDLRQRVGDRRLVDEAAQQQADADRLLRRRKRPRLPDLRHDEARSHDRPSNQLWEEADVKRDIDEGRFGLNLPAVYVDDVADRVKRVEADADWENDSHDRQADGNTKIG